MGTRPEGGGDSEGEGTAQGPSRRRGSAPGSRTRGVGREAGPSRGAGGTLTRADCGRVRSLWGRLPLEALGRASGR